MGDHPSYTNKAYSAYDPNLTISGQPVPILGNESFKFLGRKIAIGNNNIRLETKNTLVQYLEITNAAKISGSMKMWLYNNYIVPYITWQFTIYDLHVSYGEELKTVATKYLKKWADLTKTITTSVLYRNKDHFGLGLTDLTTHLKKMQVCKMHINKYSQDATSRKLYTYMKKETKLLLLAWEFPLETKYENQQCSGNS